MAANPDQVRTIGRAGGRRQAWAGGYLAGLEAGAVLLAAPLLLFPTFRPVWTAAVLVVLLCLWLAHWAGTGQPGLVTPFNVSLVVLLLMVPVAVWVSALPALTLPKLTGLVLGVAAWRATLHAVRDERHLGTAAALYLALGLALATTGLVSAAWLPKWPALDAIVGRIPRLVEALPGAEAGIHPNELAGTLLLFLPLALAGLGLPGSRRGVRAILLALVLWLGAILVLTQSRGAWLGAVAGLAAMAWLRWPRARWFLAGSALLLAEGAWLASRYLPLEGLSAATAGGTGQMLSTVTLEARIELWSRALVAIQDFAFTGCGLGTFRQVVWDLYPPFLVHAGFDFGHTHNVFFQVALDVGLPGLVAYLALVGTALWMGGRAARSAAGSRRWLGLGIAGGLVAFHVYGLTDAIALGAKPGLALWLLLALAAALWTTTGGLAGPQAPQPEGT